MERWTWVSRLSRVSPPRSPADRSLAVAAPSRPHCSLHTDWQTRLQHWSTEFGVILVIPTVRLARISSYGGFTGSVNYFNEEEEDSFQVILNSSVFTLKATAHDQQVRQAFHIFLRPASRTPAAPYSIQVDPCKFILATLPYCQPRKCIFKYLSFLCKLFHHQFETKFLHFSRQEKFVLCSSIWGKQEGNSFS